MSKEFDDDRFESVEVDVKISAIIYLLTRLGSQQPDVLVDIIKEVDQRVKSWDLSEPLYLYYSAMKEDLEREQVKDPPFNITFDALTTAESPASEKCEKKES